MKHKIELFTCNCYPREKVVSQLKRTLTESNIIYDLSEYNIDDDGGEYIKAASRFGRLFGFKNCYNLGVDGKLLLEGFDPDSEDLGELLKKAISDIKLKGGKENKK